MSISAAVAPSYHDETGHDLLSGYLETLALIERLHRLLLDVIKDEFERVGRFDINSVQALLLFNIGSKVMTAGKLKSRGYYQGSNVSYNIKKLTEMGYLVQRRAPHDKRSVTVALTEKAHEVVAHIRNLEERIAGSLAENDLDSEEIGNVCRALRRLEGVWTEVIHYGRS